MRMSDGFLFWLFIAVLLGGLSGFFIGRITAPSKVERIVERVLVPTVTAVAETIAFKQQCLLDVAKLGRENKVCSEKLGVARERMKAQEHAAQRARDDYESKTTHANCGLRLRRCAELVSAAGAR
ncbi:hypothetical protein HC761_00240 [bacterium]|nr:hypothetical protein [bacterium]